MKLTCNISAVCVKEILPVLLLGRLAIDKKYHNQGLGSALLRDAMIRAVNVADDAGVFAIFVYYVFAIQFPICYP